MLVHRFLPTSVSPNDRAMRGLRIWKLLIIREIAFVNSGNLARFRGETDWAAVIACRRRQNGREVLQRITTGMVRFPVAGTKQHGTQWLEYCT